MAKSIWQTKYEELLKRIPEEVERCVEDYGLELCEDGLEDFYSSLGVDYTPKSMGSIHLSIEYIKLAVPQNQLYGNRYPQNWAEIERELERAADKVQDIVGGAQPMVGYDIRFELS